MCGVSSVNQPVSLTAHSGKLKYTYNKDLLLAFSYLVPHFPRGDFFVLCYFYYGLWELYLKKEKLFRPIHIFGQNHIIVMILPNIIILINTWLQLNNVTDVALHRMVTFVQPLRLFLSFISPNIKRAEKHPKPRLRSHILCRDLWMNVCSGVISAASADVAQTHACICLLSMGSFASSHHRRHHRCAQLKGKSCSA